MERHPDVTSLSSESLVQGRVFELRSERVRLPSGLEQELLIVDHPGAVAVVPRESSGDVVLVRQYRHAAGDWLEEIPAGRLDPGEEPLAAAKRELEEETGLRARTWRPLVTFLPAPGFCSERMFVFLAEDLEPVAGGGLEADEDEELEVLRRSPEAILSSGAVVDGKTLLAVALLEREDPRQA